MKLCIDGRGLDGVMQDNTNMGVGLSICLHISARLDAYFWVFPERDIVNTEIRQRLSVSKHSRGAP